MNNHKKNGLLNGSILKNANKPQKGFTLVELLIVIAILAILYSIAAVNVAGMQAEARTSRINGDLKTLELAIESYFKNRGLCPQEENYQTVLFNATPRILDENLMDPFGETMNTLYKYSVSQNRKYFVVYSIGPKRNGSASVNERGDLTVNGSVLYETNAYMDMSSK